MDIKELEEYLNYKYPIEIRYIPENEGGGVSATIPFLGEDAFIGDGENVEEALSNLDRIKEKLFKYYLEKNIKIPLPPQDDDYSGKFVLRVPKYLHRELVKKAEENNVSLNTYCVSLLSKKFEEVSLEKICESITLDLQKAIKSELKGLFFYEKRKKDFIRGPVIYVRDYAQTA